MSEQNIAVPLSEILTTAKPLIKRWEGLRLKPYLCSAGVPTIGYGSTYYLNGDKVSLKDPAITKDEAETLLDNTIVKTYLPAVIMYCPTLINKNQYAAILSWTYNLGVGALKNSTMRKRILESKWDLACIELKKWNKAGGKVEPGLVSRRESEANLFNS